MPRLDRLLRLAAAAVILAALLPLGARLWWGFELASHFRLQYAVAGLVLALLLMLRRRFAWSAALAAASALGVPSLLAYPPLPVFNLRATLPAGTVESGPSAVSLKIASANLFFRNTDPARLAPIVEAASPDLVVLEEFTPAAAKALQRLAHEYPHRVEAPARGPYGIALLSRYPLADARPFALGQTMAIKARVTTPSGSFTIIGVHLRSPTSAAGAAERNRQLGLLAAERARVADPLVVIGDFNVSPFSPYYRDWLAAAHLDDTRRGRTYLATWPTFLPIFSIPIDHCFVSKEFRLTALRRLAAFGSDHYPLVAELLLEHRDHVLTVHR